jgi:hypothetical protein
MCLLLRSVCAMLREREHFFQLELMELFLLGTWTRFSQMNLLRMNKLERKREENLTTKNILQRELPGLWATSFYVSLTYQTSIS